MMSAIIIEKMDTMEDQVFKSFMLLLNKEKNLKSTIYTKADNSEITPQELETAVKNYWKLLEPEVQKEYEEQLSSANSSSKVNKFVNDVNRSLNGVKTSSIDKQLEHFANIELPNHSKQSYIFLEPGFEHALKASMPNMSENRAFIGNTQTQLAGIASNKAEDEKTQLFQVTSNLIAGLITNKSGHSRTTDKTMMSEHGQILDASLVVEVAKYAIENFETLKTLNPKAQKFIGGELKQAYKTKLDKGISEAFSSINIPDKAQKFEAQKQANEAGIMSTLTGLFSPSRARSNSESLTTAKLNIDKAKTSRTI